MLIKLGHDGPMTVIDAVFVGCLRRLPEGHPTGIYKQPMSHPIQVIHSGLIGDEHGDTKAHGGPEKAVHLYPAEHYEVLAEIFPSLADRLVPGSLGENLSTRGLTEKDVCIGDIFEVGTATLQVSQLRRPCWRIDARFGTDTDGAPSADEDFRGRGPFVPAINARGIPGWYFRVLQAGDIAPGDSIELKERPAPGFTLARYHAADNDPRPDPDELRAIAGATGLNRKVAQRLLKRADWLQARPASSD